MSLAMNRPSNVEISAHAAEALRRARRLPVGHARNDLRQLAVAFSGSKRKRCDPLPWIA
jgi:hypothetical protein